MGREKKHIREVTVRKGKRWGGEEGSFSERRREKKKDSRRVKNF